MLLKVLKKGLPWDITPHTLNKNLYYSLLLLESSMYCYYFWACLLAFNVNTCKGFPEGENKNDKT